MSRCIQTDHFLSAVVSQGASLRGLVGLTPTKRKRDMTGRFQGIKMRNSCIKEPVDGNISVQRSLFFSQTGLKNLSVLRD